MGYSITIISDELPNIESNWLGVYPTDIHELCATVDVTDNVAVSFKNKDKKGYKNNFIGLLVFMIMKHFGTN